MRILAISDTSLIPEYMKTVDRFHPDIITLAGDYDELSAYSLDNYMELVKKDFYDFLFYAGTKSKILVIRGNHDDPKWSGDASYYSIRKINSISGCMEISNKTVEINGLRFLGLDYDKSRINKTLLPLIEKYKDEIDVVISHSDLSKIHHLTKLKPKIIISGHSRGGVYSVNAIPVVLTNSSGLVLIEINRGKVTNISEYQLEQKGINSKTFKISNKPKRKYNDYKWLNQSHNKYYKKTFIPMKILNSLFNAENS